MKKFILFLILTTSLFATDNWTSYQFGKTGAPEKSLFKGQDNNGLFWYGQTGSTIISFDGEYFTHHYVVDPQNDLDTISSDFYMANDSTFWLNLAYGDTYDAIRLDFPSLEKTYYKRSDIPFEYDKIFSPQVSPTGEVWFQTHDSGAILLKDDKWTKFDTTNSTLPLNYHNLICFDSSGNTYLSVGTTSGSIGGVSKFDGSKWEHLDYNNSPIPKALVRDIVVDQDNALWIASDSGLNRLKDGEWSTWTVFDMPFKDTPSWKWFSSVTVAPDNTVWTFANQKHLFYKDGKWHNLNEGYDAYPQDDLYSGEPTFDSSGNVWIATTRSGIVKFDYEKCSIYPSAKYPDYVRTNSNGESWSGFSKYDKNTDSFLNPLTAQNSGLANDNIKCIAIMHDNRPIVVSDSGVSIRDSLQRWTYFNSATLSNFPLNDIDFLVSFKDTIFAFRGENTTSNYCAMFSNEKWEEVSNFNLPIDAKINDVFKDLTGKIWLATSKGITTFSNGICTEFPTTTLPTTDILQIAHHNNSPVVGLKTGVYNFVDNEWQKNQAVTDLVSQDYITDIVVDKKNHLWISTLRDGILFFNNSKWQLFDSTNSDLVSNNISFLECDKLGNIWVATENKGISKYDGMLWNSFNTENSSILSNEVTSIAFDQKNTKWFGTKSNGLNMYEDKDSTKIAECNIEQDTNKQVLIKNNKVILSGHNGNVSIYLYDLRGRQLMHVNSRNKDIIHFDLPSYLSKGVYFLRIFSSNNQAVLKFTI